MISTIVTIAFLTTTAVAASNGTVLELDLQAISRSWGEISNYADNAPNSFGVQDVGLPDGCQIEQAHLLQRHAQRFPTSGDSDGGNNERFAQKIANFTEANPESRNEFTGPLAFLSSYSYIMSQSYLTGIGASTEFLAGVTFWNRYGRTLFNASTGQIAYSSFYVNGTARRKPVLRTTSQSRIENSQINWALGFFGDSFSIIPDPGLANFTLLYDVVIIPEGGTENNTLASYDSCANDNVDSIGYIGDDDLSAYIPKYLSNATKRLQTYLPPDLQLTTNDTYAMQSICAYETQYIGQSDFCFLFTADEWAGFEYTTDIQYYYDYAWGNPTARAQGIGYVQELLARLENQYITSSNSSVNSTYDDNAEDFPLGEPLYADFSHDDIIISVLTALSIDYFRAELPLDTVPPPQNRTFVLSELTPFGGRLVTEVIGCSCSNPAEQHAERVQYYPAQYGYDPSNSTYKFIRMRINNGILPLSSIPGGGCKGRTDGMCAMEDFIQAEKNATDLANYQYACFANYTIDNAANPGKDYDGTIFP